MNEQRAFSCVKGRSMEKAQPTGHRARSRPLRRCEGVYSGVGDGEILQVKNQKPTSTQPNRVDRAMLKKG